MSFKFYCRDFQEKADKFVQEDGSQIRVECGLEPNRGFSVLILKRQRKITPPLQEVLKLLEVRDTVLYREGEPKGDGCII